MRKLFLILFFITYTLSFAQTQQGVVKTPTRRNVNGLWTQGQYISQATVGVRFTKNAANQSYVSGSQGRFSFSAASSYYITSVSANHGTYTFLDADFSKIERRYSSNAVEVLVDDPNVLAKVREEAEAHERSKIRRQIRQKEDEIEELKETNKITLSEYNQLNEQLEAYRRSSEAIVHQLAEIYATTDFDNMDDFNRELLACVEDGDFARADSLLKTKGSKETVFAQLQEETAALAKTKEEIRQAEEYIDKEKAAFAQRLYSEHLMFLQQPMMQDSALYCLKLRADIDTTNVEAVRDYAYLAQNQNKFDECERYYQICLRAFRANNDLYYTAAIENNLGNMYSSLNKYDDSERFLMLALDIRQTLFEQHPDEYREELAATLNNLGYLYNAVQDYESCMKYFLLAKEHYEKLFEQTPDGYRWGLAALLNNLGILYSSIGDTENCEKYFLMALTHKEELTRVDPKSYRPDYAMTLNNLGVFYYKSYNYEKSKHYYLLALENKQKLFDENPDAYRRDLAVTLTNIGALYRELEDYANSEKHLKEALRHNEYLFDQNPDAFRSVLARTLNNLGDLYISMGDYEKSDTCLMRSLEHREILFKNNPDAYRKDLAMTLFNLGTMFTNNKDYAKAEHYLSLTLEHFLLLYQQNQQAYTYYLEETNTAWALLYDAKGTDALMQGRHDEALDMWKKVLELNPRFLDSYPNGTSLSNGLKELGLIE